MNNNMIIGLYDYINTSKKGDFSILLRSEDKKDKKNKFLVIIIMATLFSTCGILIGTVIDMYQYLGNIIGLFVIFYAAWYVVEKLKR